jgi:hypothetical protein
MNQSRSVEHQTDQLQRYSHGKYHNLMQEVWSELETKEMIAFE